MAQTVRAALIATVTDLHLVGMAVSRACTAVGLPRSSYYRVHHGYHHYTPVQAPIPAVDRAQPARLSVEEKDVIFEALSREDNMDLSVQQVYWKSLEAEEIMCSQRTFYRVAKTGNLVGDRRCQVARGHRHVPVAAATRPNQLWSWDTTLLNGPGRQQYRLMLIIDVYARYPIGWCLDYSESGKLAGEMLTDAIMMHGIPEVVHSDNGGPMRSQKLLDLLQTNGVIASHSRPRVSDDNPFSESMFKTIKYSPTAPAEFESIEHARAWTASFLNDYAHNHRHSGIGFYPPKAVYDGTVDELITRRQSHLDRAWSLHPERFHQRPVAARVEPTGINIQEVSQTS